MLRRRRLLALLLAGAAAAGALHAEPEPGVSCKHWAVLLPEDGGQHRVYDGIRKGLELAQLERLCLKDLADEPAAFQAFVAEQRALPAPGALLFAVGERAAARLLEAGFVGPGVIVSSGPTVAGEPLFAPAAPPPGVTRVRGDLPAETLGQTLRDALGAARPRVAFVWAATNEAAQAAAARFATAGGLELVALESPSPRAPQALLHVRLGAGERLVGFAQAREQALTRRAPLVSDDPSRHGAGAALVVAPDPERLGRQAAEAGRRTWRGEPPAAPALGVRECRVAVDVDACEAQGLTPTVAFLARVHDLRMRPPAPAGTR
jgi:hypothetical protein